VPPLGLGWPWLSCYYFTLYIFFPPTCFSLPVFSFLPSIVLAKSFYHWKGFCFTPQFPHFGKRSPTLPLNVQKSLFLPPFYVFSFIHFIFSHFSLASPFPQNQLFFFPPPFSVSPQLFLQKTPPPWPVCWAYGTFTIGGFTTFCRCKKPPP